MDYRFSHALLFLAASLVFASPAAAQEPPSAGDIVINEVLYDPSPQYDAGEYVELLNRSGKTFDLSTFSLADDRGEAVPLAAGMLAPGDYAVLVQEGTAFQAVFPEAGFTEPAGWPQLNNTGDTVQLLYEGAIIDAVPYEPGWGGADVALERIDPEGRSDTGDNFGSSTAEVGTPGAQNTLTGTPEDTAPPELEAVTVSEDHAALTAVFSEALDPASVEAASFSLEADSNATPVVTRASVRSDAPEEVMLSLSAPLSAGGYALVVALVRDEAGNTLQEGRQDFVVAPGNDPEPRDVVVNEFWYGPDDAALEFVELLNRSDELFDLSRFQLADDRGEGSVIANRVVLFRPGTHVVLARDSSAFAAQFPDVAVVEVAPWPALNNGGDTVVLLSGDTEIDAVPYEPFWGGDGGASLERIDPAGPSGSPTNFGSSTAAAGATPGAQNAIFAPDTEAPRLVFAREVLGTEQAFAVVFSEPLASASVEASRFTIGGRPPASAEQLEEGHRVRLVFERDPGGANLSVEGVEDLTGNVSEEQHIEVAFVARPFDERPPGELVINEILYDPLDDAFDEHPNQPEFVELFNPTNRRLAVEGYVLTDRPDEEGTVNTVAIGRPGASVPPQGFAVAYAAEGGDLRAAFPETDFSDSLVTLLPVDRSSLGLLNDGDVVALRRSEGALLDSVFYRPEWQSRAVESGDGRALERIDPRGPSNSAVNWTTATGAAGGTPGRPNRAAPPPGEVPAQAGVEITPSPFSPDGDGIDDVAFIRYMLDAPVSLVRVRIYDAMGREVYEHEARLAGRAGQVPWNGRTSTDERLNVGAYVVLFEALDADDGAQEAYKDVVVLARPLN